MPLERRTGGGFSHRVGRGISTMRAEAPPGIQVDCASFSEREEISERKKSDENQGGGKSSDRDAYNLREPLKTLPVSYSLSRCLELGNLR